MSLKYKCSMPDSRIHLYQLPDFSVRHQSRFNDVFLIVLYVEDVLLFILCKYNQMNAHIHIIYAYTHMRVILSARCICLTASSIAID